MIWTDLAARWSADPGFKVAALTAAALLVAVPAGIFAARRLDEPPRKPGRKRPASPARRQAQAATPAARDTGSSRVHRIYRVVRIAPGAEGEQGMSKAAVVEVVSRGAKLPRVLPLPLRLKGTKG